MKTTDFINEHITIDERTRANQKLIRLCKKHKEFIKYLEMIMNETVLYIFGHLNEHGLVCYSDIKEDVTHKNYSRWINYLVIQDFVKETTEELRQEYTKDLLTPIKPLVYVCKQKGKDFLKLDLVQQYLNEEYKNVQED